MIPLSRLIKASLKKAIRVKQSNGTYKDNFQDDSIYGVAFQELTDQVSASIYGANINKTFRITSPLNKLEKYLMSKSNTTSDNISKYFIFIDDNKYKIVSTKLRWVDIELV